MIRRALLKALLPRLMEEEANDVEWAKKTMASVACYIRAGHWGPGPGGMVQSIKLYWWLYQEEERTWMRTRELTFQWKNETRAVRPDNAVTELVVVAARSAHAGKRMLVDSPDVKISADLSPRHSVTVGRLLGLRDHHPRSAGCSVM